MTCQIISRRQISGQIQYLILTPNFPIIIYQVEDEAADPFHYQLLRGSDTPSPDPQPSVTVAEIHGIAPALLQSNE